MTVVDTRPGRVHAQHPTQTGSVLCGVLEISISDTNLKNVNCSGCLYMLTTSKEQFLAHVESEANAVETFESARDKLQQASTLRVASERIYKMWLKAGKPHG